MIGPASRTRRSPLLPPRAVALAVLAFAALASGACGGKVVVDAPSTTSPGGSGGVVASGGTGATLAAGGGPFAMGGGPVGSSGGVAGGSVGTTSGQGGAGSIGGCSLTQVPGYTVMLACALGTVCPAADTPAAQSIVMSVLGLCDLTKSTCCAHDVFAGITCGPAPSDGDCCYVTLAKEHTCG